MLIADTADWVGRAFCLVGPNRPEFRNGSRGAYVVFCCRAHDMGDAFNSVCKELLENDLHIRGFDYFFDINYMDREISEYERMLQLRLEDYPVQFTNVHFFAPDG